MNKKDAGNRIDRKKERHQMKRPLYKVIHTQRTENGNTQAETERQRDRDTCTTSRSENEFIIRSITHSKKRPVCKLHSVLRFF